VSSAAEAGTGAADRPTRARLHWLGPPAGLLRRVLAGDVTTSAFGVNDRMTSRFKGHHAIRELSSGRVKATSVSSELCEGSGCSGRHHRRHAESAADYSMLTSTPQNTFVTTVQTDGKAPAVGGALKLTGRGAGVDSWTSPLRGACFTQGGRDEMLNPRGRAHKHHH
jgi:hypothetical protein